MAKVVVKMPATMAGSTPAAPERERVPDGEYMALVAKVTEGFTQGSPPIEKIQVEYQIMWRILENNAKDESCEGRRIWQNYIYGLDTSVDQNIVNLRMYELKMLLLATATAFEEVPVTDEAGKETGLVALSFDTDHIVAQPGKEQPTVRIVVANKTSKRKDATGQETTSTFTNVTKVDVAQDATDDQLV